MKKLIAILLVMLAVIVFAACSGETTTTASTTPKAPVESTPVVETTTTPKGDDPIVTTAPTTNDDEPADTDAPTEGIDIMLGDVAYNAIDPFWNQSLWPCAFEQHHPELDFNWCLVFKMLPTSEFVQEELISMDADSGVGTAYEDYKWILTIDGTDHVITEFSIPQRTGFIYVRMGLGADFKPVDGVHEYDIKLRITDAETNEVIYWAYFTTPDLGGLYEFEAPKPIEMVPATKPGDVEVLENGAIQGIAGPAGVNASETYVNLFDGEYRTKLCAADATAPIIFAISDSVATFSIKGISIVGANDDEKFPERVFATFKVYGADSGDADAAWTLLTSVDKSADFGTVTNYGEYYYAFDKASAYRFYKVEIITEASRYQASEILLYAELDSVTKP